ncbi:MAG: MarR family transcriptional regulator [Comamonas sp.]
MQYQPAELENYPGYHIRRLQQIAVAVFMEEVEAFGVTPVQYAAMSAVLRQPGVDQRTLARNIGFDTSTIGSVIDRLEVRGLMLRNPSPTDRRVRQLTLTDEGRELLQQAEPAVLRAQRRMLEPLPDNKRAQFMELIALLIHENDEFARAPSAVAERSAEGKRTAAVKAVKSLAGKASGARSGKLVKAAKAAVE